MQKGGRFNSLLINQCLTLVPGSKMSALWYNRKKWRNAQYMSVWGKNKMTIDESYKKRYKAGDTPWDTSKPDFNLIQTVNTMAIKPCKALEIGCGTGDNSIWLS